MSYHLRFTSLALATMLALSALTGCGQTDVDSPVIDGQPDAPAPIVIGTLPTEDMLPLWVAQEEGLFDEAGLEITIINFQAAQERDAAFVAGEIDAFMGDIIASAALEAGESGVTLATVMLGATSEEGRFGIVGAPGTNYASLTELAGVKVGTSSATIQEYVLDGLMGEVGVAQGQIAKEEVKKVPVRYDLLMKGQIQAAMLPEPFLSLAEKEGAPLLSDDTTGTNLSQTVLGFSDEYLAEPGGIEAMTLLLDVWDQGAALVNEDPDAWRELLVEQARVPEPIKDSYEINTYPMHEVPTKEQVESVLEWMQRKGLLTEPPTYEDLVYVTP
ncbi:MAG: nitrate ABC transporter substrate-binding protein [Actinobacteria bacterium HGW-Actinobacteria-9]|nr:MAG: nitrate ABC transporter substrate-binding protein [Actinobacteria bacterium HGW-Actinobacteria-9]